MRERNDNTKGWIGSVIIHAVIILLLFFWHVDFSVSEPEFIEMSWGTVANVPASAAGRPRMPGSQGATVTTRTPKSTPVDLPQRKSDVADEVLKIPPARKINVEETPSQSRVRLAENSRGQKELSTGIGLGQKEKFETPGSGETAGEIAESQLEEAAGSDVGKSVSVSMQWSGGGTRKKISGELPTYPEGVNVGAQIKIETVVLPDGSVKALKPAQKGNTKLEEAAMKAVRLWMFEPLRSSSPQIDQTCLITFNFHLK